MAICGCFAGKAYHAPVNNDTVNALPPINDFEEAI